MSQYFRTKINLEKHGAEISSRFLKSMSMFAGISMIAVNLSTCGKITDDAILSIATNCPNLKKVILSNCWKLTDYSLHYIGQHLVMLEHLDISHCNKLTGAGFQNHMMIKLKCLNASYCKAISDKALEKLLSLSPDLTEIWLRRCSRLTEFGFFLIIRFCR